MAKCTHGNLGDAEITSLRPDGVHELDPCEYELAEIHENVDVFVHVCNKCGHVDISWSRTPLTKSTICNEELSNKIAEEAPVIHKALCGVDLMFDNEPPFGFRKAPEDEINAVGRWPEIPPVSQVIWTNGDEIQVEGEMPTIKPIWEDGLKYDILEETKRLEKELVSAFSEAVADVCVTFGFPIEDIVESVHPMYKDHVIHAYFERIKQEKEDANESENN